MPADTAARTSTFPPNPHANVSPMTTVQRVIAPNPGPYTGPGTNTWIVDAGPVGYRSIVSHGHADALAFTLSIGGLEFLIDPGTYAYHTQGPWRQYFRGTAAHSTLRVDGKDQSQFGGNFIKNFFQILF